MMEPNLTLQSDLNLYYGTISRRLKGRQTSTSANNEITAFIGPSGCGKSTFSRPSTA